MHPTPTGLEMAARRHHGDIMVTVRRQYDTGCPAGNEYRNTGSPVVPYTPKTVQLCTEKSPREFPGGLVSKSERN